MRRTTANDAFYVEMRTAPTERIVERLIGISLLKTSMVCDECQSEMTLVNDLDMADGKSWRCPKKRCKGKRKSIRNGSFFENTKLSLSELFCLMYYWAVEKSVSQAVEDLGISLRTVTKVYERIRAKVGEYIDSVPLQLGGPGIICQIDESCFSHKVKAHRGRAPRESIWVFGIIDSSQYRRNFHVEIVANRSANTLLPIISRNVLPGTTIYSDEWAAYARINSELGLTHGTVNHSLYFVDPSTGVHTQKIESLWNVLKYRIKTMKGVRREHLPMYLKEFMWRNRFGETPYASLFSLFKI